jgi:kynurenine formamidase
MSFEFRRILVIAALIVPSFAAVVSAQPDPAWIYEAPSPTPPAERSPRRTAENIGSLSMMTPASRTAVLARLTGDRVYDLSVQYFIGLPSWYGADDLPPIIARGVLIDVVSVKPADVLTDAYRITRADLEGALASERVSLKPGDIVLIRGGKITLEAAEWLAEGNQAMIIGGDRLSLELYRVGRPDLTVPVHNYLLRQRGIAIIQVDNLDELARDRVYEFAFVAASLRPRGSNSGAVQFRPLAFPLRPDR